MPVETLAVPHRFRGPPASVNGGYACGLVARHLGPSAEVTLRSPWPLDTPVVLQDAGPDDGILVRHGDTRVAEGRIASLELHVIQPVSVAEAEVATAAFAGFRAHPFPGCFVCGTERAAGDGQRIFPGPVPGRAVAAAPWRPDATVAAADGRVAPEHVWAALDCPTYFGATLGREGPAPAALLGRMTARLDERPEIGEPCVLVGWLLEQSGRKIQAASALFGEDGRLHAAARATWITIP